MKSVMTSMRRLATLYKFYLENDDVVENVGDMSDIFKRYQISKINANHLPDW